MLVGSSDLWLRFWLNGDIAARSESSRSGFSIGGELSYRFLWRTREKFLTTTVELVLLFQTKPNSPEWKPNADVNNDGVANIRDVNIALLNFQKREQ